MNEAGVCGDALVAKNARKKDWLSSDIIYEYI